MNYIEARYLFVDTVVLTLTVYRIVHLVEIIQIK